MNTTLHSQSHTGIRNQNFGRAHSFTPKAIAQTDAKTARADETALINAMKKAGMVSRKPKQPDKPDTRLVEFGERRRGIVDFVRTNGVCRFGQIFAANTTCDDSIRRDLRALVSEGLLTRERDVPNGMGGVGYVYEAAPQDPQ